MEVNAEIARKWVYVENPRLEEQDDVLTALRPSFLRPGKRHQEKRSWRCGVGSSELHPQQDSFSIIMTLPLSTPSTAIPGRSDGSGGRLGFNL
jgi:hypothetical protein